MTGIPDPEGVSGTFAALERTTPIVQVAEGVATTTSMRIANGTQVQHKNVLELIRNNLADLAEFGGVASETRTFDTAGGPQQAIVYLLTEEHATLLLTYMRNSDVVRDFKKRLVREFYEMRRGVTPALTEDEIVHQALQITARKVEALTAEVAELKPKAEFYDDLMDADGCYSMGSVAKQIGWGRNVMMRELRRAGVLQGNNLPYQRYAHHFKVIPRTYTTGTGETHCTATTFVLPSGVEFIRKRLSGALELAVTGA